MKKFTFLILLLAGLFITSCEVTEDEAIPTEPNKTYLVTQIKYTIGNSEPFYYTYTYNSDNKVETITQGENEKELVYDNEGRLTEIYSNSKIKEEYSYANGKIFNTSYIYYDGELMGSDEYVYSVNGDGKLTSYTYNGEPGFFNYTWTNGNKTKNVSTSDGNVTKYTYNEEAINPAFDQYLLQHPMYESKNVCEYIEFAHGDETTVTITTNNDGYITKSITVTPYTTASYTYTYKVITE